MRSSDNTGWIGNDPGWPLGVPIPAGDPLEEILEYNLAYPDGSTEPLPQVDLASVTATEEESEAPS